MNENLNPNKDEKVVVTAVEPKENAPKGWQFPTAFTVLFIVLLLVTLLTWVVPAGKFKTLTYNADDKTFVVTDKGGNITSETASQEVLDKYRIPAKLESFENEDIKKPMAIPGTYENIPSNPQGLFDFLQAPINGILESANIIVFILVLGGCIGIVNRTGTFDAGINSLSKVIKGKEFLLVVLFYVLIAIGGTTFGLAEETIALYPILMPVFLASGFDAMVCLATIYMASSIGTMFSTVNPFSVVIASNAAGINFKSLIPFRAVTLVIGSIITLLYIWNYHRKVKQNPENSLVKEEMPLLKKKYLGKSQETGDLAFTLKKKLTLIIFALGFAVMIWGVVSKGWWFENLSTVFLATGILLIIFSGLRESEAVGAFMDGAADLVSVALVVGVARAINIIMDNGAISDTLLNATANAVTGMNGVIFVSLLFVLFSVLGLFIPSSSGLATLSMPIVAPLADSVNMGRHVVVSAYNWGQGWMAFITPTGLILATLDMAGVTFNKWLKFIMPLMGILGVYSIIMLAVQSILLK